MDGRSLSTKNAIWALPLNDFRDDVGMNRFYSVTIRAWGNFAVLIKVRLNTMENFRPQSLFHWPSSHTTSDNLKRGVAWPEAPSKELRRKKLEVIFYRKFFGFGVNMVDGCCGMATQRKSEGPILD